jgi:type IV fimbrial biogenesis protein FimT
MLRNRAKRAAGFTLIELMVTVSIFALLTVLAVPTMQKWVANAKVRAVADSLQNGIRLAQTEALRRSRQVVFALTNTQTPQTGFTASFANGVNTGSYWAAQTIPADPSESAVLVGSGVILSNGSPVQIVGPPVALCFNSAGRLVQQVAPGPAGISCIAPTLVVNGVTQWQYQVSLTPLADHPLTVEVALGGQIRLCDPSQNLSATNPYGC